MSALAAYIDQLLDARFRECIEKVAVSGGVPVSGAERDAQEANAVFEHQPLLIQENQCPVI